MLTNYIYTFSKYINIYREKDRERVYGLLSISTSADSYICSKYFNLQNKTCTYRYLTENQCFVHTFYINDMGNYLGPVHGFSF